MFSFAPGGSQSGLELYMQIANETKSSRLPPTPARLQSANILEGRTRRDSRTLNMTTNGRFVYGRNLKPSLGSSPWETLSSSIRFLYFQLFIISLA